MVEVFKTNVESPEHAALLVAQIHRTFSGYQANFDLDDCDNILRVASDGGFVDAFLLIGFLRNLGYQAQVLPDDALPASQAALSVAYPLFE